MSLRRILALGQRQGAEPEPVHFQRICVVVAGCQPAACVQYLSLKKAFSVSLFGGEVLVLISVPKNLADLTPRHFQILVSWLFYNLALPLGLLLL